jgi:hypothetical protein
MWWVTIEEPAMRNLIIDGAAGGETKRRHDVTFLLLTLHHGKDSVFTVCIFHLLCSNHHQQVSFKQWKWPWTVFKYFTTRVNVWSRWASFWVVTKKNVVWDGKIGGAWWWSGEVLVGHWPAFEVKFHRYFSYFLYIYAILPKIAVTKSRPLFVI